VFSMWGSLLVMLGFPVAKIQEELSSLYGPATEFYPATAVSATTARQFKAQGSARSRGGSGILINCL
jgi:hypothetical protein